MKTTLTTSVLLLALATGAAEAQTYRSAYTDLDLERCTIVSSYEVGADYSCPGYDGIPVYVTDSDLRFSVSYGPDPRSEYAFGQGFTPFNGLGPRIEWLINDSNQVVGTILRWYIARPDFNEADEQVLVVTKLGPGTTCHVAYVDARANGNANQLARSAAEMLLPGFNCASDGVQTWGEWSLPEGTAPALGFK